MVDRLRFMGHLPAVLDIISPGQHFSTPEALSSAAYHIRTMNIDNHLVSQQLQFLEQLDAHPDLVGPPDDIQPGHAVLAPWEGSWDHPDPAVCGPCK